MPSSNAASPPSASKVKPSSFYQTLTDDESDEEIKTQRRLAKADPTSNFDGFHVTRGMLNVLKQEDIKPEVKAEEEPVVSTNSNKSIASVKKKASRPLENKVKNSNGKRNYPSVGKSEIETPSRAPKAKKLPNGTRSVSTPGRALDDKTNHMRAKNSEEVKDKVLPGKQPPNRQAMKDTKTPGTSKNTAKPGCHTTAYKKAVVEKEALIEDLCDAMDPLISRIEQLGLSDQKLPQLIDVAKDKMDRARRK